MANPIQPFSSGQQIAQMPSGISAAVGAGDNADFLQTLDGMLNQVGTMQTDAQQQVTDLLQSDGQDVHSAMIAVEKADLSFQLMMQVRNKIVQAYQTISQIPF
ncbi:MAG: flagellar hook-basal body complex protein FliE [Candidatus Acidiferrales bacterium]